GLLALMPSFAAIYNPSINSYKRLVPGAFTPTHASWGIDNRTAAVRVILGAAESSRFELRLPGADSNPYLVAACAVAAVDRGLFDQLEPPLPQVGPLPP